MEPLRDVECIKKLTETAIEEGRKKWPVSQLSNLPIVTQSGGWPSPVFVERAPRTIDIMVDEALGMIGGYVDEALVQLDMHKQGSIASQLISDCLRNNEDGDATLFVKLIREKYVYDHASGRWFYWNGQHWEEDLLNKVLSAVSYVVDLYKEAAGIFFRNRLDAASESRREESKDAEAVYNRLIKRIEGLQTLKRKHNVIEIAKAGEEGLGITGEEWDRDPLLLGCRNGVVDLKAGALLKGSPGQYIRTAAPVDFKGLDVPAPNWEAFLCSVFKDNDELIRFLRRLFGYAITGYTTEHVLPILWGQGRNGKSTLLEVLASVLGKYAGRVEAELLLAHQSPRRAGTATPEIMALMGKRLVSASETDEDRHLNRAMIKLLTGGDTLAGRELYGRRQIEFTPSHTIFLVTNHKPRIAGNDYALWRRLLLVPFEVSFVHEPRKDFERKADLCMKQKLQEESSGILGWLVRGCLEWQREGLNPPECVKAVTREYRGEEDSFGQFLNDCFVIVADTQAKAGEIHEAYKTWAGQNGVGEMSMRKINRELVSRGFRRDASGRHTMYKGLGLKA